MGLRSNASEKEVRGSELHGMCNCRLREPRVGEPMKQTRRSDEKHTGTQDPARGASRARLAAGVREWLHLWGYPWSERDGVLCVDPLTHA